MADPKSRRQFLRSGIALLVAGTAGCSASPDGGTRPPETDTSTGNESERTPTRGEASVVNDTTPTSAPCGESNPGRDIDVPRVTDGTATGDFDVTIRTARLAEAVVYQYSGLFKSVRTDADPAFGGVANTSQFLQLDSGSASDPPLGVRLAVDGTERTPGFSTMTGVRDFPIGLSVPVAEVSDVTVRFVRDGEEATWDMPAELTDQFDAVPEFSVRNAAIVSGCERRRLALTVENAGDRDGVFRAKKAPEGLSDGSELVYMDVPAGESVRKAVDIRAGMLSPGPTDGELRVGSWDAETRYFRYGVD